MITTEAFGKLMEKQEIIISDYDGVMQLIDVVWVESILYNREHFKDIFDFSKIDDETSRIENIVNRDSYYLNKWLLKEGIEIPNDIFQDFMDLYMKDEKFYDKIRFTPIATAYGNLLNQKFVEKIIFLSHHPRNMTDGDIRKKRKIEEFKKQFNIPDSKIQFVDLPDNIPKSKWINENCPDYTAFIDDRMDIVKDVILNTNSENKTFCVPRFGYSKIEEDEELVQLGKIGRCIKTYLNLY